ncbi:MAG: hypothetical protein AAGM22_32475 [Acidobacteriota bacterium]
MQDPLSERFTGADIYLQNNANPPGTLPELSLRGGAFIPPISTA